MVNMFVIPTWLFNKSRQQEKQYNYYEKQVIPNVEFISADVPVIFRFTFEESESYDFEKGSILRFPKEYYGIRIDVTIDDELMLYKHDDEIKQIALDTDRFHIETEKLYNKIRQERGELPKFNIDSYIDRFAINRKEHVTYSERYVGRY